MSERSDALAVRAAVLVPPPPTPETRVFDAIRAHLDHADEKELDAIESEIERAERRIASA